MMKKFCHLDNLVKRFYGEGEPMKEFESITNAVGENECRGTVNEDGLHTHSCDVVAAACVKKRLRPCAIIYEEEVKKVCRNTHMNYIVCKRAMIVYNDRKKAFLLRECLMNYAECEKYHEIVGDCLGYPAKDVKFFIEQKFNGIPKVLRCPYGCLMD